MLNLILILIGCVFYYLAYKSPKTDLILYFMSGMFFLFTAIAGFNGYGDIQISENISYNYTTIENETLISNKIVEPVYSESLLFNRFIPITEFLLSLYIFMCLAVEPNNYKKENGRKVQSGDTK